VASTSAHKKDLALPSKIGLLYWGLQTETVLRKKEEKNSAVL